MNKLTRFTRWHHYAEEAGFETILPDGCVDVLILSGRGRPQQLHLTKLDCSPRRAFIDGGTRIEGFRLCPGIVIDEHAAATVPPGRLGEELESVVRADADILYAVGQLAAGHGPTRVASRVGVSLRSLQRRLRSFGLPSPDFWRLLGRARGAATALIAGTAPVEVATGHGYADQAHLTRELVRWLGITPGQLRDSPAYLNEIRQPGLGNWTGEQISTR